MLVKSFCCCLPLAFGAFVIGLVYLTEAVYLLWVNIIKFNQLGNFEGFLSQNDVDEIKQSMKNYHLLIIINLMHLLSTIVLFIGLACPAGGPFIQTAAVCSFTIHTFMMLNAFARAMLVRLHNEEIIFFTVAFVISCYFTLVLWSYAKQLERKRVSSV